MRCIRSGSKLVASDVLCSCLIVAVRGIALLIVTPWFAENRPAISGDVMRLRVCRMAYRGAWQPVQERNSNRACISSTTNARCLCKFPGARLTLIEHLKKRHGFWHRSWYSCNTRAWANRVFAPLHSASLTCLWQGGLLLQSDAATRTVRITLRIQMRVWLRALRAQIGIRIGIFLITASRTEQCVPSTTSWTIFLPGEHVSSSLMGGRVTCTVSGSR